MELGLRGGELCPVVSKAEGLGVLGGWHLSSWEQNI